MDERMKVTESTDPDGTHRITIDPGRVVLCDSCNRDFTDSSASGGILFQSNAIGPCCEEWWTRSAERYNEGRYIRARCPAGMSFADWVRLELR